MIPFYFTYTRFGGCCKLQVIAGPVRLACRTAHVQMCNTNFNVQCSFMNTGYRVVVLKKQLNRTGIPDTWSFR